MAIFNGWRITRAGIIFVAGLVILAGLVFAGVYWVAQRGEQARREEAIQVAEQNLEQQSDPIAQEETNNGPVAVNEDTEEQPEALPETGTELVGLLAVTALALATGYYVQSRRTVRDL
jgi:Flp pilus assembly protein TadB